MKGACKNCQSVVIEFPASKRLEYGDSINCPVCGVFNVFHRRDQKTIDTLKDGDPIWKLELGPGPELDRKVLLALGWMAFDSELAWIHGRPSPLERDSQPSTNPVCIGALLVEAGRRGWMPCLDTSQRSGKPHFIFYFLGDSLGDNMGETEAESDSLPYAISLAFTLAAQVEEKKS